MSEWSHPICDKCWQTIQGDRVPVRVREQERDTERCCWCHATTFSGIYMRADPALINHVEHVS